MATIRKTKKPITNAEKVHDVSKLYFDGEFMYARIDGSERRFVIRETSDRLYRASPAERDHFEIDAYGYGIHWPLIDEDLSIDGLLGIRHEPPKFKTR